MGTPNLHPTPDGPKKDKETGDWAKETGAELDQPDKGRHRLAVPYIEDDEKESLTPPEAPAKPLAQRRVKGNGRGRQTFNTTLTLEEYYENLRSREERRLALLEEQLRQERLLHEKKPVERLREWPDTVSPFTVASSPVMTDEELHGAGYAEPAITAPAAADAPRKPWCVECGSRPARSTKGGKCDACRKRKERS